MPDGSQDAFYAQQEAAREAIARDETSRRKRDTHINEVAVDVPRFLSRLGREPFELGLIEFRIVRFLASKPYKAFTRERIAKQVSSPKHPVAAEQIDEYVRRLRDKLGMFSDFVQSVPLVGYRFKP